MTTSANLLDFLGLEALERRNGLVGRDGDHLLGVLGVRLTLEDDADPGGRMGAAAEPDLRIELLVDFDNLCAHERLAGLDDLLDRALRLILAARVVDELLDVDCRLDLGWSLWFRAEPRHGKAGPTVVTAGK